MININNFLILAGIIYFIIDFKQFMERRKTLKILEKDIRRKKDIKKINKSYVLFILFIMGFSFAIYIYTVSNSVDHVILEKRQYTLFLIVFLSRLILKIKIYKHQRLSLLIAFVGFFLLSIFKIKEIPKEDIIKNIICFVGAIFYAIHYTYLKYLEIKYELPIYISYIFTGMFSLITSFIAITIVSKCSRGNFDLLEEALFFLNII